MKTRNLLLVVLLGFSLSVFSQESVRVMTYNLLNYPGADTSLRNPYYRTIVSTVKPHILVVQEITSQSGVDGFLSNVMNSFGDGYSAAPFIDGYDSDNALFYRTSHFDCVANIPHHTALRDINEFVLVHKTALDTFRIFSVHLKSSSGVTNEELRFNEVDPLRAYTDSLLPGSKFMICGDFNFYHDAEPAYLRLIESNPPFEGEFYDPITMINGWNNASYAPFHTQSPRTRSFGGGITGGMDDRFDLLLFSKSVYEGTGSVNFIAGTYTAFGNDGYHYNDSINKQPNTAVSVDVANALHYASDHIPVYANILFENAHNTGTAMFNSTHDNIQVVPNPSSNSFRLYFSLTGSVTGKLSVFDSTGKKVVSKELKNLQAGKNEYELRLPASCKPGTYRMNIVAGNSTFKANLVYTK